MPPNVEFLDDERPPEFPRTQNYLTEDEDSDVEMIHETDTGMDRRKKLVHTQKTQSTSKLKTYLVESPNRRNKNACLYKILGIS